MGKWVKSNKVRLPSVGVLTSLPRGPQGGGPVNLRSSRGASQLRYALLHTRSHSEPRTHSRNALNQALLVLIPVDIGARVLVILAVQLRITLKTTKHHNCTCSGVRMQLRCFTHGVPEGNAANMKPSAEQKRQGFA